MADTEGTIHLERFTSEARNFVAGAQQLADDRKHAEVSPLHLLVRMIEQNRGVAEVFKRAGADLILTYWAKDLAQWVRG